MKKSNAKLVVKPVKTDFPNKERNFSGYGITDGKKWFAYAYPTQEKADGMLKHFSDADIIRVNIAHPSPISLIK